MLLPLLLPLPPLPPALLVGPPVHRLRLWVLSAVVHEPEPEDGPFH